MPATFCPECGQRLAALPPTQLAPRPPASLAPPVAVPEQASLAHAPTALAEKIRASRAALEGERKQVTVLFADIKDSLELICGLDPEAAQQLLDPALQAMIDAVHRYEGTVNQVLGDGIMGPLWCPDCPRGSCRSGLLRRPGHADGAGSLCR
jgi:class 3 adenylate cyclase